MQFLVTVEEFRGHRYLDDLRSELGSLDLGQGLLNTPKLPALRRMWTTGRLAQASAGEGAARVVDAMTTTVTPSDTLAVMFTSGSSGPPKGVVHSHGNALGAMRSGLAGRCIDSDTHLYLPMPSFWVGGFGGGVLSALLAGAILVTEEIPQPEATLRLLEIERVTLFRGWPDQAEALARRSNSVGAGISAPQAWNAITPEDFRDVMDINVTGTWNTVMAAAQKIIDGGRGGSIILISSAAGIRLQPFMVHYTASNHAVTGIARAFAAELGKHSIRVNTVHAGPVNTDMGTGDMVAAITKATDTNPQLANMLTPFLPSWIAEPKDIADAECWLASDESLKVSAAGISVDQGSTQY